MKMKMKMKIYRWGTAFVTAITCLSFISAVPVFAETESLFQNRPDVKFGHVIQTQEIEVTGDDKTDSVMLTGKKEDQTSPFYSQLYIVVSSGMQAPVAIPLPGGYSPQMQFCDFNGDKLPEIYVAVQTGGSSGISNFYMYSIKHNTATAIPVPGPIHITASFQNNYKIKMKVEETGEIFMIAINDKKQEYEQAGVYKNGKLKKPVTVMVNEYHLLSPFDVNGDGICELRGVQRITGLYNADTIGYASSLWQWNRKDWVLVASQVNR